MNMRIDTKIPLLGAIFLFLSTAASAQGNGHHDQSMFNLENGVALKGYDPVSYIRLSKAVKGSKEFSASQHGVTYLFSNQENRRTFVADPDSFEPAYGGWCAYAMGETGEKVDVDPETFKVSKGRLYLFYNRLFNNTLPKWNKDEERLRARADQHWMNINK